MAALLSEGSGRLVTVVSKNTESESIESNPSRLFGSPGYLLLAQNPVVYLLLPSFTMIKDSSLFEHLPQLWTERSFCQVSYFMSAKTTKLVEQYSGSRDTEHKETLIVSGVNTFLS